MPVMQGAKEAVESIRSRAKIKVASSRPYETQDETEKWLRSKYGFVGVEFINTTNSGKAAIDADMLIDDNIDNLSGFIARNNHRWGVLLIQPWNETKLSRIQSLMEECRIIVAKDWDEIASWLAPKVGPK